MQDRCRMAEKVPATLAACSESSIIKSLGDLTTGKFTCGGSLDSPSKVLVNYLNKTGSWCGTTFPGLGDADFLDSSSFASFGKGKETVTDKNYRDAYTLDPEKFTTSFQLSDTRILGEIRLLLTPDVLNIRAQLYKMNIYTAPTGCFKAHVDTSRASNMFGSLVVCLPSQYTGGDLARHGDQEVTYDWSSPAQDPMQKIQWAAFFSDIEHEILPLTEGYRVTLTYNLYHCNQLYPAPTVDIITSPFYKNLKRAIEHPHFLRRGGILGFACQHAYIFEGANHPQHLLKGGDHIVLLAAKLLGLKADIKPILKPDDGYEDYFIDDRFEFEPSAYIEEGEGWREYLTEIAEDASHIIWCQKFDQLWKPAIAALMYGNEYSVGICYQAAAILVTIPAWSVRSGEEPQAAEDES